ncbi:MAG: hypothetical protein COU82_00070 [Candidatus Portnoybacteria bacterium CG10_big_fil_rev_8_21_14_0_10_38_18]|uniref:Uncharacterized protein n=1 Tax=Candidatus Portnoybacteria bacterium CG10_big_fil_rev_8_21_14_0_10_38_18 TaxID=1974813 RepID=A0A2M8KCZ4_9BACT|nr:MAG: hypothetical protein COU82_00070 [Candidatus Portnoybacteria bacterium CG10_big_fil_rev_8_21_14_0_10_38_18]
MQKIKLELKDKPIEPLVKRRRLAITPKRIILVIFILFLILVLGYFWKEICFLIKPPYLEVSQPPTDITTNQQSIEIIGKTSPFAYLTIKDLEVYIDKEGNFRKEIELSNGINNIKIEAKNRFGKTNIIIRRIIFNQ